MLIFQIQTCVAIKWFNKNNVIRDGLNTFILSVRETLRHPNVPFHEVKPGIGLNI